MSQKVSVIIPVYRSEETLERCVLSLINGDYPDLEILLIEDCSPDNSWAVCQQLEKTYTCIRAFRNEKNSGPSATRNRGLQEMTGQYLMFVDSDDWVEPSYVSSFVNLHLQYYPDMIVCGYVNHDEVQNARTDNFGWQDSELLIHKPMRQELPSLNQGRLLQQIWNKFFLADIIRENNIRFDTSIHMGEDFRFLLNYLQHVPGDKLSLINLPLYHYNRSSGNSLMSQFGKGNMEEPLKDAELLYRLIGVEESEIQQQLIRDRQSQLKMWAYLIMHNMGMGPAEKRRLILSLDKKQGKKLYRQNVIIRWKERILILAKKMGLR